MTPTDWTGSRVDRVTFLTQPMHKLTFKTCVAGPKTNGLESEEMYFVIHIAIACCSLQNKHGVCFKHGL